MNAPRALEMNPGKKRTFRILFHQAQQPMRNPVGARKGKKATQLRAQTKFGPPLQLPTLSEMPFTTEIEIRRRVGQIDDHLLAKYPQITEQLVPWLAARAASDTEISSDEIEAFLEEALNIQPGYHDDVDDIINELLDEKILFDQSGYVVAGPGVGKPPPFNGPQKSARWALINVGAEPDHDKDIIEWLKLAKRVDADSNQTDEEPGFIDENELEEFIEKHLFTEGEYKPDEASELIDKLKEANVVIGGPGQYLLYYHPDFAGRSGAYVAAHLKQFVNTGLGKEITPWLRTAISDHESKTGNAGHYDQPPTPRKKADRYVRVAKASSYATPARPVEELQPGDRVLETGPVAYHGYEVVSVEHKGEWYTVTVKDEAGKTYSKRAKKGRLFGVVKDAPVPEFVPGYHPAVRMKIDNPKLVEVLQAFEGREWGMKQRNFPVCPKCVGGNRSAWEVLQSLGSRGKGLSIGMLLDGAGRIEGSKETGHLYEVDAQGYVNIVRETATKQDIQALAHVGVDVV